MLPVRLASWLLAVGWLSRSIWLLIDWLLVGSILIHSVGSVHFEKRLELI